MNNWTAMRRSQIGGSGVPLGTDALHDLGPTLRLVATELHKQNLSNSDMPVMQTAVPALPEALVLGEQDIKVGVAVPPEGPALRPTLPSPAQ